MSKDRLNIFIEPDHAKRLRQLAARKGESQSAIVAAALASFLSVDGTDRREAAFAARLDRLSRHLARLERDQTILIETLALFVRYTLSVSPPIPDAHKDAARAQGRVRFEQFVEQLGRHLQRGNSLVRQLQQELEPEESQFLHMDETDSGPTPAGSGATEEAGSP